MCTARSLPYGGGGVSLDRVPPDRDPLERKLHNRSPPPFGQTDGSEKITLPQTSFAGGKNEEAIIKENAKAGVRCECALVISDRSGVGGGSSCRGWCLPAGGGLPVRPQLWTGWQTRVKTLPCRNYVVDGNENANAFTLAKTAWKWMWGKARAHPPNPAHVTHLAIIF